MKKLLLLTAIVFSMVLFAFNASAKNQVSKIDAEIVINDDGSADFYQTWHCDFGEDTEVYYFFPDEGRYEISEFVVMDEDKIYDSVTDWDTSLSFAEKAGKCGILRYKDGYELCWGITEYGNKTYNIYFRIDNLVTAYKDADATYFCLFSENVDTRPTDMSLKISLANGKKLTDGLFLDGEFTDSGNCDIRKTLYLYPCDFKGGKFIIKSDYPMTNVDCLAFSITFQKGLIDPVNTKSGSAEKSVNKYFNKYVDDSFWEIIKEMFTFSPDDEYSIVMLALVISIFIPLGAYFVIRFGYWLYVKSIIGKPALCKNEPSLGINASYLMLKDFKLSEDKNLLTLIFLDMIKLGAITPIMPEIGDPVPYEKGNIRFRINIVDTEKDLNETEKKFYKFLKIAAKEDMILDPYEIRIKSQDYCYTLRNIMKSYTDDGEHKIKAAEIKRKSKLFSGPLTYTAKGKEELRKILGYKKYLMEYSSHNSVDYYDYDLWEKSMRYAAIFGDDKKITDEMLKTYPGRYTEIKEFSKNMIFAQHAGRIVAKNVNHMEKNYSTRYHGSYRSTAYRSSYRGGGGGFRGGGGGRSGGGTR